MAPFLRPVFIFSWYSSVILRLSGVAGTRTCYASTDAIIVLDASGSVGFDNWHKSVKVAADLGNSILSLYLSNKVGVIEFSQVANEAISLTNNKEDFDHGIQVLNETYQNGITRTELALSKAEQMFKKESVLNDNRLLVIVTDGQTTPLKGIPGTTLITTPVNELKEDGVHIIAVGVTDKINIEELNLMATDPDSSNVLMMSNYDDLLNHVSSITKVACPTQAPTAPVTSPSPHTPDEKCEVSFHKIGCFHDDMQVPRPLPDLLFTDRDETSPVSSGITLDWDNWSTYLSNLVCRCSKAANAKGYLFFSIQYYAECWSGAEAGETYKRNGMSSYCINKAGQPCTPDKLDVCAGEAETNYVYGIDTTREATCGIPYEKLGCFKDNHQQSRPLGELILTDRDPTDTAVYSGRTIDWGNWDTYLTDFVCRCARKAAEKKYNYFGIQYYGECWSAAEGGDTFAIDGTTDTCVTFGYNACPADPKANTDQCAGKEYTNYVYGIQTAAPKCSVKYQRIGCYNDNASNGRALPELIFTDRDPSSEVYSNVTTDWGNWDAYMDGLICRCARVAQNKRYFYFGVQNYAECWSGPEAAGAYSRYGKSPNCVAAGYKPCEPSSGECVGKDNTNFVYKIELI